MRDAFEGAGIWADPPRPPPLGDGGAWEVSRCWHAWGHRVLWMGSNLFGVCCAMRRPLAHGRYFDEHDITDVPLFVSGTLVDQSGRTLSGQTTEVRQGPPLHSRG